MRCLLLEIDFYSLLHTRQAFAIMCRSSPPPQSRLALGRGEVVTWGRGVPKLCPHLATFHVEAHTMILWFQVWAQLRLAPAPGDHLPPGPVPAGTEEEAGTCTRAGMPAVCAINYNNLFQTIDI